MSGSTVEPRGSHAAPTTPRTDAPLVVDLDGTLIRTDLLSEAASAFVSRSPWKAASLAVWLRRGKLELKRELAARHLLEAATLPFNEDVLTFVRAEQQRGRPIIMATASLSEQAREIADHLEVFDDVVASTPSRNLRAEAKRDLLVERYGEGGFDYIGNHKDDRVIWASARHAYVVSHDPRLIRQVDRVAQVFPAGTVSTARAFVKATRPHQWVKNLLVVLPLLAAQLLGDPQAVLSTALAFVAFSLTASSVYLLNDLADVASDRSHPSKRHRPFAAGDLDLRTGWLIWPLLLVVAFTLSIATLPGYFTLTLAGYLVLTVCYTVDLKRRLVVDALTLALLYTLRVIAGAAATGAVLSFWLLTFSLFFFLSLAFLKRVSELSQARRLSAEVRGRGYVSEDLELLSSFGVTAGYAATVVLALYVNDERTAVLYDTPEILWASVPLILFWVSRAWLIAHRGNMHEDPILYAVRDRVSLMVGGLVFVVFVAAQFLTL